MRLDGEATVGERIAFYRRRRGMSQEVLAGLLGRSTEWLSQFERGAKELDRISTVVAVANALGIEPIKLLPSAFTSTRRQVQDAVLGTAPDAVPTIKDAMFRYDGLAGLLGVPDRPQIDHDSLLVRIEHAFRCSQTERWSETRAAAAGPHRRRVGSRVPRRRGRAAARVWAAVASLVCHLRNAGPDRRARPAVDRGRTGGGRCGAQ